jgi:hypothetical protein
MPNLAHRFSSNKVALGSINRVLYNYYSSNPETGEVFQLDLEDLNMLLRFQNRTVRHIGSQWDLDVWEFELMRLVSLVKDLCCYLTNELTVPTESLSSSHFVDMHGNA